MDWFCYRLGYQPFDLCDVVGMSADHLRAFQYRKPDPVPDLWGAYLALIPCVVLAVGLIVAPYLDGPAIRLCTLP